MQAETKYDAFISYRHLEFDKQVAVQLQKKLENYRPPASVKAGGAFRKLRVFRDETELSTSNSLSDSIRQALQHTRYLFVVCSAGTAQSRWCLEEIRYFKQLHGGSTSHIRVIVIQGQPQEVLPEELLWEERPDEAGVLRRTPVEPLALNLCAETRRKALKKLNTEYLRLAATLLAQDFETLYRRGQRRFWRRVMAGGLAAMALLLGVIVYGGVLLHYANQQKNLAQQNLEQARSLLAVGTLDYAAKLEEAGARTRAASVLQVLYGSLGENWENRPELETQFRDVALGALYYDANAVYASLERPDEILSLAFSADEKTALVVVNRSLCTADVATGVILQEYQPPAGDLFTSATFYPGGILAGLQSGGLLDIQEGGAETQHPKVSETPIERIVWRDALKAAELLSVDERAGGNTLLIHLDILPLEGGGFAPGSPSAQRFTLPSDALGDITCRYSFSQNGRFLAAKKNLSILLAGDDRTYQVDNRDVCILDTDLFDPAKTHEENQKAMLRTVDARFETLGEDYTLARYLVDDDGLLFLDLQTVLYDGIQKLGYLTGSSLPEGQDKQQIAVYDLPAGELRFLGDLAAGGDLFFSSFLPVDRANGFLPYVRYDRERNTAEFLSFNLSAPNPQKPDYRYALPEGCYGGSLQGAALPRAYEDWPPQYLLAVNQPDGQSRVFRLRQYNEEELTPGAGSCTAAAIASGEEGIWGAGFKNGTVQFYSALPSPAATEPQNNTAHVLEGEVYKGEQATGVSLACTAGEELEIVSYNQDRSLAFGYTSPKGAGWTSSVYKIWRLDTGAVQTTLRGVEEGVLPQEISIGGDFSWVVWREASFFPSYEARYHILDIASGQEGQSYTTTKEYDYFGAGRSSAELWFVSAGTGVLETIDITGGMVSRQYLRNFPLREVGERIYYSPANNYVVVNNSIYSFASQKEVYRFGHVASVSPDGKTLYLAETGAPIGLTAEELYARLCERPNPAALQEEERKAAGLDLL